MKPAPDQAVRDRVRTDFGTNLILEAGAGTGKTTVLVDRLVNLVVTGATTLDRVVAITFTEAAAGELKMRLRDSLEACIETASPDETSRLSRAIIDLERANVSRSDIKRRARLGCKCKSGSSIATNIGGVGR